MSASSLAEPIAVPVEREEAPAWPLPLRILFRFGFVFFLLFYAPFPLTEIPGVFLLWEKIMTPLVVGFATSVFGVSVDPAMTGSGDKLYHWVQMALLLSISGVATLVWSIADRKSLSHPRLYRGWRIYLRFALAFVMFTYGVVKVIPSQFPPPPLDRLMQPVGDMSPMGMLWTFMGASVAYNVFTGIGEILGGLLLTMRRTTLLGALITAAVMTQVLVLNLAYDVPVKLFSFLLLVTALVIAAPDAKRLSDFFLRAPLPVRALWPRVLRTAVIVAFLAYSLNQARTFRAERLARMGASPIYGIWEVNQLTIDGVSHPPLTTDATRWRRLIVSGREFGVMQQMNDVRTRVGIELDEAKHVLTIKTREPVSAKTFNYELADARTLMLDGVDGGKKVQATLQRVDERKWLLRERGFHWVSEKPFNR